MKLATILDEYHPYLLKNDGITDLQPALDGGYLPDWAAPEPRPLDLTPTPPPINFWSVFAQTAFAVLGLTLVLLALLSTMGVI